MQPLYCRAERVVWRHASGGVMVLPGATANALLTLSGTGEDVWELLDEPRTIPELAQQLAERYGVPESTVMADLTPVLDDLTGRGVLVRTGRP